MYYLPYIIATELHILKPVIYRRCTQCGLLLTLSENFGFYFLADENFMAAAAVTSTLKPDNNTIF